MKPALALALCAAALAGCSDSGAIEQRRLSTLVLHQADLGAPFDQFDEGPLGVTETTGALRVDPVRFGRQGGWKARFKRPGDQSTSGPLVIESRADLFEDADGAARDLDAYRKEFEREAIAVGGRLVSPGGPTAGAVGLTFREGRVRFFRIAWRHENATALLFVNGFDGLLDLGDVLELARTQQRRLAAAS